MRLSTGYVYSCGGSHQHKFQGFFLENRKPIWLAKKSGSGEEYDPGRYGQLDETQFSESELRMYALIKAGKASMQELKTCYTLDEALKLYALVRMDTDIESAKNKEFADKNAQSGGK